METKNVDWRMIEIERRLMQRQCFDGRPGLSEAEIGLATGLGDRMDTAELRQRYLLMFGFAPGLRRDLPSLFAYGYRNVEAALAQILRPAVRNPQVRGLGRVTVSPRPLAVPTAYELGSYSVTTATPLSESDALRLRLHLLKEFQKKGVLFAPGDLKVAAMGTTLTVAFPLRPMFEERPVVSERRPARRRKKFEETRQKF